MRDAGGRRGLGGGPGRAWRARHEAAGPKSATKTTRDSMFRVDSVVGWSPGVQRVRACSNAKTTSCTRSRKLSLARI